MLGSHAINGRAWVAGFSLAFAAACGGEDGERPSAGEEPGAGGESAGTQSTDPCAAAEGLEFEIIEDFENGRARLWWTSDDGTPGAEMEPPAGRESPPAHELAEPRCGESQYAFRLQASGLHIYGGAMGRSFLTESPEGRDATEWDGLALWVKKGPARGNSIYVALNDQYTDITAGTTIAGEAYCDDDALYEYLKCDRFGAGVGLEDEWRLVTVRFDEMKQRGYGVVSPGLDVEALAGINVSFEAGDWDFYIDDLAFYRER